MAELQNIEYFTIKFKFKEDGRSGKECPSMQCDDRSSFYTSDKGGK
jgi:hypothetical protein